MSQDLDREFGTIITRLINKENLTRDEAYNAFVTVLDNRTTQMQQGAFLSALTSKGETALEVAGAWDAIYNLDTVKISLDPDLDVVENSGTGMDTFKTYNISTAAAIIAAGGGVAMARHGARAITSVCGTVDMAEALGINVECSADQVASSIKKTGLGLFNGMSPHIHPNALGRILSQIFFGSTLNIAASLANPALPSIGVRGVYAREMIMPVAQVMAEIGYKSAIVLYGSIEGSSLGMDEASVCGITHCARISGIGETDPASKPDGGSANQKIREFTIDPKKLGLATTDASALSPEPEVDREARRFAALIQNKESGPRKDAALLNAGLIFLAADKVDTLDSGIEKAARILEGGKAFETLENWVSAQGGKTGLSTLHILV